MKFNSTRGKVKGISFEEALFSPGYQADGGLLMPETIPKITKETLQSWANYSYPEIGKAVLSLFIDEDDIPKKDLDEMIDKAYARIDLPDVVKLKPLTEGLNILEMFHGRTLAFKDLSTFVVGQFMSYFLRKKTKHITLLVGTSGDTGSSSIEGVRGVEGLDIVVLYPVGRISTIQERSMTTIIEDNVHIFAADGSSDDIDEVLRNLSLDQDFRRRHNIGTMNSINIARVLCQSVSFFYSYLRLCHGCDDILEVIAPTGAAGNVTGGLIASKMGLPVKLVCAVNENNIIHRTLSAGDFSKRETVIKTLSPAIDIQNPYNMERIFWLLSKDCELINQLFGQLESSGATKIPDDLLQKASTVFSSFGCDDNKVKATMQRCWKENSYLICPHTAVGVACYYKKLAESNKLSNSTVVLATASPAKFPEAVRAAGLVPEVNPTVNKWLELPTRESPMAVTQDWVEMMRRKVEDITRKVEGGL